MPGSLLIGYDGSPSAAHAIRSARALLTADTAIVATIWEAALPASPTMWGDGLSDPVDPATADELNELSSNHAQQLADHGAEIARAAGFAAETAAVPDELNVAETLAKLAAERNVDAIVIGSHGHGALRARVLGSTSSSLLHHAACPVLMIPRPPEAGEG